MVTGILIIAIILVLLFPKIFEFLSTLIFSRNMSTTIIDAVDGSVENIISLKGGGGPVPMLNIIQSIVVGVIGNIAKSIFYILFTLMFGYLILIILGPFCVIVYVVIRLVF